MFFDVKVEDEDLKKQMYKKHPNNLKELTKLRIYHIGVNQLTLDTLKSGVIKRAGILVMDFPGPNLIQAIIDLN